MGWEMVIFIAKLLGIWQNSEPHFSEFVRLNLNYFGTGETSSIYIYTYNIYIIIYNTYYLFIQQYPT